MNILPLIPQADFFTLTGRVIRRLQGFANSAGPSFKQMTHCKQCRADACGILGEDKDMELEVLMARIGEEYIETV